MTPGADGATGPGEPGPVAPGDRRLAHLDALRGVAIVLVVLYHAYARYPELIPFGARFADVPLISRGGIGVPLFFMISGFVILMTLERCRGFADFILRRWLRLFPAMLACSLVIYATAGWFPERPLGTPVLRDVLPGLTFIEPLWWAYVLGPPQGVLEGAFWSLFVEVKFYVLFAGLYFLAGSRRAIVAIFGLFLLTRAFGLATKVPALAAVDFEALRRIAEQLSFDTLGWFAAGTLFYRYHEEGGRWRFGAALAAALIAAAAEGGLDTRDKLPGLFVVVLFASAAASVRVRALLANRFLLLLGFASYPVYLLHENMLVAMIVQVGRLAPELPQVTMPVLPMLVVLGAGWFVARTLEPRVRAGMLPALRRLRARVAG